MLTLSACWHCRRCVELQALLLILENATFACPENAAQLISPMEPASPADGGDASQRVELGGSVAAAERKTDKKRGQPFCAWLVQRLPGLYQAVQGGRIPHECVHSALAVLMNVAHNSVAGREVVEGAGAVETAAQLLLAVAAPFLRRSGAGPHNLTTASIHLASSGLLGTLLAGQGHRWDQRSTDVVQKSHGVGSQEGCVVVSGRGAQLAAGHRGSADEDGRWHAGVLRQAPDAQALSHLLGLLINLVEDSTKNRRLLVGFGGRWDDADAAAALPHGIVSMLCQLIALSPG